MTNVIVTRYSHEPPSEPLNLNGILFDHWLNVQTGEKRRWRNGKWEIYDDRTSEPQIEERQCNNCGETWVDSGDLTCPFCGSEDTQIIEDPGAAAKARQ